MYLLLFVRYLKLRGVSVYISDTIDVAIKVRRRCLNVLTARDVDDSLASLRYFAKFPGVCDM